ncbi:MAG: glycosyltransferase family 4 protein [Armatimonadota bacterium]
MNIYLIAFVMALAIAYIATPRVRQLALALNVIIQPGGRRIHSRPMPLWGGIAIFGAFIITVTALMGFTHGQAKGQVIGILVAGALLLAIGLLDDMTELSAAVQAGAIVAAAFVLGSFGVRIQWLTNPFGDPAHFLLPNWASWALTVAWVFMVTKTLDFMDGLDGLAAGIGAIAAGVLGVMAYYSGQPYVALVSVALSGACIGFLRFNFNPAKIFMGTGGSQFIGFALAAISIIGAFKVAATIAIALPVLVLGVPIFDGLRVLVTRLVKRQPIHVADRSHLHHHLLNFGLSHKQAVFAIWTVSIIISVTALAWFLLSRG